MTGCLIRCLAVKVLQLQKPEQLPAQCSQA